MPSIFIHEFSTKIENILPNLIDDIDMLSSEIQSLRVYLEALSFLRKNSLDEITIGGDEILLHPHLSQFLQIAKKWHFSRTISTTLCVNPQKLRRIFSNLELFPEYLECKVYSKYRYTDDQYRSLQTNLFFFQASKTNVSFVYSPDDISQDFSEIISLAKRANIRKIHLRSTKLSFDEFSSQKDFWDYGNYIFDIISKYGSSFLFVLGKGISAEIFDSNQVMFLKKLWVYFSDNWDDISVWVNWLHQNLV